MIPGRLLWLHRSDLPAIFLSFTLFSPDYFPPNAYYGVAHGNVRICRGHPSFYNNRQPLATGYFHGKHRYAPDSRHFKNIGEFLDIGLGIVELRTTHHEHLAFEKITVELGIGKGGAVRRDQQISTLKERRG